MKEYGGQEIIFRNFNDLLRWAVVDY